MDLRGTNTEERSLRKAPLFSVRAMMKARICGSLEVLQTWAERKRSSLKVSRIWVERMRFIDDVRDCEEKHFCIPFKKSAGDEHGRAKCK